MAMRNWPVVDGRYTGSTLTVFLDIFASVLSSSNLLPLSVLCFPRFCVSFPITVTLTTAPRTSIMSRHGKFTIDGCKNSRHFFIDFFVCS